MAGGAPMDCAQPLIPHITANVTNITAVGITECASPSSPIRAFTAAERMSPVAMKRLMLQ